MPDVLTRDQELASIIARAMKLQTAVLLEKIAQLEARPMIAPDAISAMAGAIDDLRVRFTAIEARAAVPGPPGSPGLPGEPGGKGETGATGADGIDGKDGAPGLNGKDGRDGLNGKDGANGIDGTDGIGLTDALIGRDGHLVMTFADGSTKDVGLVVGADGLPGLAGTDGTPGLNGKDGTPGLNGKDGADGLGFDDLTLISDEADGFALRFQQGARVKDFPLPVPHDAKVWQPGRTYLPGAGVTVKGSWWIAQVVTSRRPGDDDSGWRLAVRAGRDGKPGKDGKDGGD